MSKFNSLYKIASIFFNLAQISIKPMREILTQPGIEDQLDELEEESFSKYEQHYINDSEDIKDDMEQPGSAGFALVDGDKVLGYLYGYDFIYDDNWDDLDIRNPENRWFKDISFKEIKRAAKNHQIFYITNLAIKKDQGGNFLKLALALKNAVQGKYKFVVLNALSDSNRILTDESGNFRLGIIRRFGLEPVASKEEDGVVNYLFEVK
jgi:hypothetical protein